MSGAGQPVRRFHTIGNDVAVARATPKPEIARRQMSGWGGMLSFALAAV